MKEKLILSKCFAAWFILTHLVQSSISIPHENVRKKVFRRFKRYRNEKLG